MNDSLTTEARSILSELWLGSATKPAAHLYPHQWSWDSAFIAIGNRHIDWDRAALEMVTLFEAQWANGMVPHIVFSDSGETYFPNAQFWDVMAVCQYPPPKPSSGICQPPVHATAALRVYEARPDAEGLRFLRDLYPKLLAWHDYLYRHRCVDSALAEIWHPWESGMDNSPAWDGLLAGLEFTSSEVPTYRRVDTEMIDGDDRPSDAEYDRYAYLVGALRSVGYEPRSPEHLPFRVRDVLFNSALARSEVDLAEIAALIGIDESSHIARAIGLATAIDQHLWNPASNFFHSQDANTERLIPSRISGGLMALLMPLPSEQRGQLLQTMQSAFAVPVGDNGLLALTAPEDEPGFDAVRYWRGPAWIQMNWLLASGLDINGEHEMANRVRSGIVNIVTEAGFHEYFNPRTMRGHGTDRFGWTAALLIDVLSTREAS
ncbi:MAG: glycoside hydrolase [Acidimicrobiales bacterium]|nr:glycoside hydrolase [Acidimicrobiales bacterium]